MLVLGALLIAAPGTAVAATRIVDNGTVECPNAQFSSINAAIDAPGAGDTIIVCPGTYAEGEGDNGVVIDEAATIRGAGADKVRIEPAGSIGLEPGVDRAKGNVVLVDAPSATVEISGVTVTSGSQYAEAGVVFHNVNGRFRRSRITNLSGPLVPAFDEGQGVGIYAYADAAGDHAVEVADSLLEGYGKGGVVFSSWDVGQNITGATRRSVVRGRGPLSGPGQGQNGIQISGPGASMVVEENLIADHRFTPDESSSVGVLLYDVDDPTDTNIHDNEIQGNGYGVFNADENGCDRPVLEAVPAADNWWGNSAGPTVEGSTAPPCGAYTITGSPALGDRVNGAAVAYPPFRTTPRGAPGAPAPQPDAAPAVTDMTPADGAVVAPDSAVAVTAGASDDFDVQKVEFLRGGTVVATDTTRPYAASVTSPGPGSSVSVTARATDSSGQTTSRSIAIQGQSLPPATTPPQEQPPQQQTPEDRPPAVTIGDPTEGAAIDPRFAPKITAQAADDQGVARVGFLDDGKVVCTDEAPPYECQYAPSGGDVGRNTLIAIAVDGSGQTAVDFRSVRVGRFTPSLTAATTPKRDKRRPYRYTTSGRLVLPPGVSPEEACANGGAVDVEMSAGRLKLPLVGEVKPDCTFKASIAFPSRRSLGRGRLTVVTRFAGNEVLGPARAKTQRVRAG